MRSPWEHCASLDIDIGEGRTEQVRTWRSDDSAPPKQAPAPQVRVPDDAATVTSSFSRSRSREARRDSDMRSSHMCPLSMALNTS